VVDANVVALGEQPGGGKERLGILLFAQVADHQRTQAPLALRQSLPAAGRLKDHPRLVVQFGGQGQRTAFLQHHQRIGESQRSLRAGVTFDVAVEVGAGEDHGQSARTRRLPARR
jgi:hypothetical protein